MTSDKTRARRTAGPHIRRRAPRMKKRPNFDGLRTWGPRRARSTSARPRPSPRAAPGAGYRLVGVAPRRRGDPGRRCGVPGLTARCARHVRPGTYEDRRAVESPPIAPTARFLALFCSGAVAPRPAKTPAPSADSRFRETPESVGTRRAPWLKTGPAGEESPSEWRPVFGRALTGGRGLVVRAEDRGRGHHRRRTAVGARETRRRGLGARPFASPRPPSAAVRLPARGPVLPRTADPSRPDARALAGRGPPPLGRLRGDGWSPWLWRRWAAPPRRAGGSDFAAVRSPTPMIGPAPPPVA